MPRRLFRLLRGQRGDVLPMAIAALAMGTMLMAPLLSRVRSSNLVTQQISASAERQYVSDAGIEMALWEIENNPAFRQGLIDNELTSVSITVAEVDGITPQVEAVCVSTTYTQTAGQGGSPQYLEYAIFGNSTSRTQTVKLTGSGHTVNGAVHTNNQFKVTGSGHVFNGLVTWSGSASTTGSGHTFNPALPSQPTPVQDFPLTWAFEDFQPGGQYAVAAAAEGKYFEHIGKYKLSGSGYTVPEGLHYCHGDASFSGSGVVGPNVTVVAEGKINISGSSHSYTPYVPGLTFFSNKSTATTCLDISGSGNAGGTCYAPRGKIALTGSGGTIIGAFLGDRVQISGSGANIQLAQVEVPQASVPVLESAIFDVRSTANGTTTTSRVDYNQVTGAPGTYDLSVLSWVIH